MKHEQHQVIVIGSGFGGAVAASKLIEKGVAVTMLERGPWRETGAIRDAGIPSRAPLPEKRHFYSHLVRNISSALPGGELHINRDGLFDLHLNREMSMICSSGVGGGSHVYSAMNVRPEQKDYWEGVHDSLTDTAMDTHYRWALATMQSQPAESQTTHIHNNLVQDATLPKWMTTENIQQPLYGFRFQHPAAEKGYGNNSFFGSKDNQKVTLDERLLLPAMEKDLVVRDRHQVLDISRIKGGFRLLVQDHGSHKLRTMTARQVILAAGTLNTLKLLFACRERGSLSGMPALGLGISGNGDVVGLWGGSGPKRDFSLGTPSHGRFALCGEENSEFLTRFGLNGLDQVPLPGFLRRRLKQQLLLVAMGKDNANGIARWHRGKLHIAYPQDANPILNNIYRRFGQISKRSGKQVRYAQKMPFTVHPIGGARAGQDPATSVVNHCGEVHDIPGLYISDASALPASPGVPPSMTIAAWASRVAEQWLQQHGSIAA